MGTGKRHHIWP